MKLDAQHAVPARMACLPQAIDFVAGFCARQGISRDDMLRLTLMVEELFSNTVVHGHGGDSPALVRLGLQDGGGQVTLLYEDQAPAFDPLAGLAQAQADLRADVADRPLGGMGIPLVVQMAASVSYAYEDGCNRLRLVLRRAP